LYLQLGDRIDYDRIWRQKRSVINKQRGAPPLILDPELRSQSRGAVRVWCCGELAELGLWRMLDVNMCRFRSRLGAHLLRISPKLLQ
jgi:hypothetical protein